MVPVTAPRERAFGVGTPPRVSSQAGRTHAATSDDRPALVPRRVRDLDRRPRGRAQRGAPSASPAGGSVRDFGIPDDRRLIWRLYRAHLNSLENLPLFASVVLVATVRGVTGHALDSLAAVYVLARIGQSMVHVAPAAGLRGNQRFAFFVVQIVCLLGLAALAVRPA